MPHSQEEDLIMAKGQTKQHDMLASLYPGSDARGEGPKPVTYYIAVGSFQRSSPSNFQIERA